jgi:hypothetical protein
MAAQLAEAAPALRRLADVAEDMPSSADNSQ